MKRVLVVAPHADDETLGCGGTILKLIDNGYEVHWLLITGLTDEAGFTQEQRTKRNQEIKIVTEAYSFSGVHQLNFPAARLDTRPIGDIISSISNVMHRVKPEQVFTVYRNDAHSDHEIVFDAVMSTTKSFRYPFVKRVLAYETISETDFGLKPEDGGFKPNVYVDISNYLDKKLEILETFESEVQEFPFPRSRKAVESLAYVRGSQSNSQASEAFILIKELL
ncbi:putative LmbE-like protein [Shewanella psychrophila]|uniref:Putative LmbE-like protein n=1 Tax=Shewanella psychrophila TaxID=225848 RepID=A0A1S6HTW2_9GAMM|nr:PIG-L deacetylase family protein [Shewanella psychrophila]AQS38858.1 putative LmbE-like protein [Shewanella psychrophila]